MFKLVKKYFVPHGGNEYKPHFFRTRAVFSMGLLAVFVFIFSTSYTAIQTRVDFLASVLPSVLIDLANQDRELYAITPLTHSPILEAAAREKVADMAQYSYFAHNSPTGITPWYWFTKAGYRFLYAGENLAVNFTDSMEVNTAWMNSPGHRANILNGSFTEIGIATQSGMYEGRPTIFVVQLFGRPAQVPVAAGSNTGTPVASASEAPVVTPKVEPIVDTPNFVAVVNKDIPPEPVASANVDVGVDREEATQYATLPQKVLSSPETVMSLIYTLLAALVLLAIVVSLAIEFKRHHARHLISGVAVLALLVILFVVYHKFVGMTLVIT